VLDQWIVKFGKHADQHRSCERPVSLPTEVQVNVGTIRFYQRKGLTHELRRNLLQCG